MEDQPRPITVLIVDDHLMVRYGLKALLALAPDLAVIGEAADGEEAFACCCDERPDVILMDIVMPCVDGPTATARIRAAFPEVQVIALTSFADETLVPRALQAGAIGYLLKDVHAAQLADAIRAAHDGRATLDPTAVEVLTHLVAVPASSPPVLTPRERQVLARLVAGESNPVIAAHLGISHGTVRLHISTILHKLGARNRTEAALLAVQHQLLA